MQLDRNGTTSPSTFRLHRQKSATEGESQVQDKRRSCKLSLHKTSQTLGALPKKAVFYKRFFYTLGGFLYRLLYKIKTVVSIDQLTGGFYWHYLNIFINLRGWIQVSNFSLGMPQLCVLTGFTSICRASAGSGTGIFSFPKDPDILALWIATVPWKDGNKTRWWSCQWPSFSFGKVMLTLLERVTS